MEDNTKTTSFGRLAFWPDMDLLSSERLLWLVHEDASSELFLAVREAVATQLSARQREVVEGHFFEGLSQPELAEKLGIRQQVVHKCLYGTKRNGKMVGGALKKLKVSLASWVQL